MRATANYFKIGLFTIAAAALLVVVIVALGAGAFLRDRATVETYLDETVQGIEVGTPVKYRGVHVGNVDSILFTHNVYERAEPLKERRGYVLVRMALLPRMAGHVGPGYLGKQLEEMVNLGLRVRLRPQGLTGLSYVEMDYIGRPDLYPPLEFDWKPQHYYVPSAPSIGTNLEESVFSITRTLKKIEEAELDKIAANLDKLLVAVTELVTDEQAVALREQALQLLGEARETTRSVREFLERPELDAVLTDTSEAAATVREVTDSVARDVEDTLADLRQAARSLRASSEGLPETMDRLNASLRRLAAMLTEQQAMLASTIENVEAASTNLRELTEDAKRYPAGVLFSEPPPPSELQQ